MSIFSKKNIIFYTKIFLFFMLFHFLLVTFLRYELWMDLHLSFLDSQIINLWKDIYLVFLYILIIWYLYKNNILISRILEYKKILIFFLLVVFIPLIFTLFFNFLWFKSLIVGFKYDIWFLFPSVLFLLVDWDKKDIRNFLKYFLYLFKIVIVFCIIFAVIRFKKPEVLYILWFWPLWDWVNWNYPPILFKTWVYWLTRLSWIFSWPNHMAFYIIAFLPILLLSIINKKIHYIWWILVIILLLLTLSRSWFLALLVELFLLSIFVYIYYKNYRKIIYYLYWIWIFISIILWWYLFVSWKYNQIILRWWSTAGHFQRATKTIKLIKNNLFLWHWLGTAWPASHYVKNDIIPESWFLQIYYELGIFVWTLWFSYIFYVLYLLFKQRKSNILEQRILSLWIFIWIIGLLVQWLVLHSFEDSMVVLPLFLLIGIVLWFTQKTYVKKN